jgi:WhiB family transcriptional regulator, redox-sensing transcriptional regulator
MTEHDPREWRTAGACASADPDLFFPILTMERAAAQIAQARRICTGCRVRRQCLEFALETGEKEGVWGGTTPEERARIRREEAARRRRERRRELAAKAA